MRRAKVPAKSSVGKGTRRSTANTGAPVGKQLRKRVSSSGTREDGEAAAHVLIDFQVVGTPRPGGSKTSGTSKAGKSFCRPANKHTATWRSDVSDAAVKVRPKQLLTGPLSVVYLFFFRRPKSHFNAKGELRPSAPHYHTKMPDGTKLVRSTEDAMTGIIWDDDSQVVFGLSQKLYCQPGQLEGARILVQEITP